MVAGVLGVTGEGAPRLAAGVPQVGIVTAPIHPLLTTELTVRVLDTKRKHAVPTPAQEVSLSCFRKVFTKVTVMNREMIDLR